MVASSPQGTGPPEDAIKLWGRWMGLSLTSHLLLGHSPQPTLTQLGLHLNLQLARPPLCLFPLGGDFCSHSHWALSLLSTRHVSCHPSPQSTPAAVSHLLTSMLQKRN